MKQSFRDSSLTSEALRIQRHNGPRDLFYARAEAAYPGEDVGLFEAESQGSSRGFCRAQLTLSALTACGIASHGAGRSRKTESTPSPTSPKPSLQTFRCRRWIVSVRPCSWNSALQFMQA